MARAEAGRAEIGAVADERQRLKSRRHIVTPEGIAISVDLADRGDRLGALLLDLLIIYGTLFMVGLLLLFAVFGGFSAQWALTMILLLSFVIRSFYFIVFELRWQGRTPGKRALGIRVIDRHGRQLSADAVFARNLMREVEVFVPASLLLGQPYVDDPWTTLFLVLWISVLIFLPFFNRDRLRAGDMLAGTWVVKTPKQALLPDIAAAMDDDASTEATAPAPSLSFSRGQLDVYGIYELQTLEDVLRQTGPQIAEARREIAARIRKKISWQPPPGAAIDDERFLEAFYTALRRHLETRLLFGERRQDKFHRRDNDGA